MDMEDLLRVISAVLLSLILLTVNSSASRGDLSAYKVAQFLNEDHSSKFDKYVVNEKNGDIYIGATNRIYHIKSDFELKRSVHTNTQCGGRCSNHNKILLISNEAQKLIACGSEIEGRCQLRSLHDISIALENGNTVVPSKMLSTEAIMARGPSGVSMLYIGATYDPARYGIGMVTPIARRNIWAYRDALLASDAEIFLSSSVVTNNNPFMINYMDSYDWKGFAHFVTIQKNDYDPLPFVADLSYVSKVGRVCQASKNFDAYTEVVLECRDRNGTVYNLVQSVHIGKPGVSLSGSMNVTEDEDILYGVFARSTTKDGYEASNSSGICIFKMADIDAAFSEAVYGCLKNGSEYELQYVKNSHCPGFPVITPETGSEMECDAFCYSYAKSKKPVVAHAIFDHKNALMSSINVKSERNHTIAFIGTSHGDLLKVQIVNKTSGRLYETINLRSPVLRNLLFDEESEHLFISTEREFLKLKTSNCSFFLTSEECIGVNGEDDGDPHCGWCTEQIRCTRYHDCSMSDGSSQWLPYNQQCTEVRYVQPSSSLAVTATEQQITLNVDLETNRYESYHFFCSFDDKYESEATRSNNKFECRSPPTSSVPDIQSGDSITVPLYVRSIPALVGCVKTDFTFYDCAIHSSCTSCVNSKWGCDWCVLDHRCTHKSSGCEKSFSLVGNTNKQQTSQAAGPDGCPQLEKQYSGVFVPNGGATEINIPAKNLPMEHEVNKWQCVITIDGVEITTAAFQDQSVITCVQRTYTYKAYEQEFNATVAVTWNDVNYLDDVYGFTVTLYKCEVDRPDCSRCLSSETTPPELQCGWCSQHDICVIQGDPACSTSWFSSGRNCPDPFVEKVWPPSGPTEGRTVIEISGNDLGRTFTDVNSITVGGWACDMQGLQEFYKPGQSVSCRVRENDGQSTMPIMVNVNGINGNLQSSNGDVKYRYQVPEIIDFSPLIGPQAGGTEIKIRGRYLNTGRLITASIGEENCKMDRLKINDTWATCRTSPLLSGNSHPLVMTFDGISKRSTESFTYQLNPEITDVSPMTSIQAGGRKMKIRGDRLDTIQRPIIFVILDTGDLKTAMCSVQNSTYMECPTPTVETNATSTNRRRRNADQLEEFVDDIIGSIDELIKVIEQTTKSTFIQQDPNDVNNRNLPSDGEIRLPIGFIMDGVQDLLRWSDYSQVNMKYVANPQYQMFKDGKETLKGSVLQLYGKNLKLASSEKDVDVLIGSEVCDVTALVDHLLTCNAPEKQPVGCDENGILHDHILPRVTVRHGNFVQDIGALKYEDLSVPQGVKVFLGIFFPACLIIVIVVLIFVMWWYRKTRTQYEIVHNREEELLDQIRSLKNALSLQGAKGRPLSGVTLGNNVRIDQKDVSVEYDQLKFQHELGKGAFGKVFQAILDLSDQHFTRTVAVKTVRDDADPGTTLKFLEEGILMKKFIHPNIMPLIGLAFDLKNNPVIVLPLMNNGDLRSYLRKETTVVNGRQLVNFALDVAYGMIYLADRKFIHRDLAARNCMVSENLVVKVADFGLSRDVHDTDIYRMKETRKLPVKWMAIECLDRKIFTSQSDVWSYGVLFWEIFTRGDIPYTKIENKDLYYYLIDGKRLECPEYCPKQIYDVMYDCWNMEAEDRPSFPDIVSRLTCFLDSNDPADTEHAQTVITDVPDEDDTQLHNNPTYLEPMDMMPANPPPAPPTYVNEPEQDDKDETTC